LLPFLQLLGKLTWHKIIASILLKIKPFHALFANSGLTAVIWTDFVQTVLMIIGAFILMILGTVFYSL